MTKTKLLTFLIFQILFFAGCKKEETFQLPWTELQSPTSLNLNAIHFTDDSTGHVIGGNIWFEDIYLKTNDAGNTWLMDSLRGKEILEMQFNNNDNGYAVGIGGDFYFKATPESNWKYHNLFFPNETFRDVSFWGNEGIIVTGGAFKNGKIIKVQDEFNGEVVDSFEQELATVFHSEKNIIHVGGYGIMLRSTDGGTTWENKGIIGDFFKDIHFPNSQVGYAVGFSGSIIKTTDAGASWNFLRNGDNLSSSNKPFQSVFFIDKNNGFIVGDQGIFWRTKNGGEDWEVIEDFPNVDLNDIFIINNIGYIVGKDGRIFKFEVV